MNILRKLLKNILPYGIVTRFLARRKTPVESLIWSGDFRTWEEANVLCRGYGELDIVEKVKSSSLKVKYGQKAFERDSVNFDEIQYSWPLLAGLLLSAQKQHKLNVVDFGGSLGSTFYQNRKFLKLLEDVSWNIIEQKPFVEIGVKYFKDDINFFESINDLEKSEHVDVVILSSVLQYLPNPYEIIDSLLSLNPSYVILDRLSLINRPYDRITIQNVPSHIYKASYPCRFFSKENILKCFKGRYEIIEEFEASVQNHVLFSNNDKSVDYGFILKRVQ